ncbi:MAG: RsiV family protein, partial [Candidatus Obscuribacterales bacterium]|nr:RsiV family protein [Candidatus Obscuribacterales bacterium]
KSGEEPIEGKFRMNRCLSRLLPLLSITACLISFEQTMLAAPEQAGKKNSSEPKQLAAIITSTKMHGVEVSNGKRTHKLKKIEYPLYVGGDPASVSKLNSAMRGFVNRRVIDCWGNLYEWSLKKSFASKNAVSAEFHYASFGEGAAHQISMVRAFNYQVSPSVKAITLDELFGQKVDYKVLSPICRKFIAADLKRIGLTQFEFQSPEFPEAQHFEGFSFDKDGITFVIDMGAESMNGYNIKVPYKNLKPLFHSSSPIFAIACAKS